MRNQVRYIVGDTNGRDHQYWPTATAEDLYHLTYDPFPGPGMPFFLRLLAYEHPIGMTLAQIQLMSWRVREWRVSASTWSASTVALDLPLVTPDDFAVLNDLGATPEFTFRIQVRVPPIATHSPPEVRDVIDEADMLGEWENLPLTGDFDPPARTVPTWKTLRNIGVAPDPGGDPEILNGISGPVIGTFSFSDPVVLIGTPTPYNTFKFSPATGPAGGNITFRMMYGYVVYDPVLKLFFPYIQMNGIIAERVGRPGPRFSLLPAVPIGLPPDDPDIPCGNLTIGFGGTGVPDVVIPIGIQQFGQPASVPYTGIYPLDGPWSVQNTRTGSFNLSMSPSSFWPYRTSNGSPVYDAATGAQINDPFS